MMNEQKKIYKWGIYAVSSILNVFALGVIYKYTEILIRWYLEKNPIRGIDIFLSAVYVNYIIKWHEFLRPFAWKYFWFGGYPFSLDYPSLYFLVMIPFANFFGLIPGIMYYAVFIWIVILVFCYFFYLELSRNKALALVLSISTLLSFNLYRSLVWAGGITYWTTQALYPVLGFLLIRFINSNNKNWLYLGSIVAGLGFMGHPQAFLNVILPFLLLVLLFYSGHNPVQFKQRIKNSLSFLVFSFLIGLPGVLLNFIGTIITLSVDFLGKMGLFFARSIGIVGGPAENRPGVGQDILDWSHNQFFNIFSDTQILIWYMLGAFAVFWVVTLIFRSNRLKSIFSTLPFIVFLFYQIGILFLFSRGLDFYIGGWYKAYWPIPIAAAAAAAVLWGQSVIGLKRLDGKWPLIIISNIAFLIIGYLIITPNIQKLAIEKLDKESIMSSLHPDVLNVKITDAERKDLSGKLVPAWLDPNDRNKRLYVVDATVHLWWPIMYELPLVRGYIDPPITNEQRWGIFWVDSLMGPSEKGTSSLIDDWKTPEKVANENTRFLLDWYAIYYYMGNYTSQVPTILASNVTSSDYIEKEEEVKIQGAVNRYFPPQETIGKFYEDRAQTLKYYKVKPELISPIAASSNASALLLIGDSSAYDTVYRVLGMRNLNSQKLIVATRSKYIDDYSLSELRKFDKLILYRYSYHDYSKAWQLIGKYLEAGGKVYIDTGPEGKEVSGKDLPAVFPFSAGVRDDIGRDWNVETVESDFTKGIQFDKFSELVFDNNAWNVSHPTSDSDLRPDAKVILKNNKKIVAATMTVGSGNLAWTGFNLPYHVIRDYNEEEAQLLINILSADIDLSEKKVANVNYNFISPEKREIDTEDSRGVLFKEEFFKSWKATSENGKELQIYQAGPTSPGYMYVPFSNDFRPKKVIFNYYGEWKWKIYHLISIMFILVALDKILTRGRVVRRLLSIIFSALMKKTKKWWQKDDEE